MKKAILSLTFIFIMLEHPVSGQGNEISVIGSNTVFPVMNSAGAKFSEFYSDVSLTVTGPGSGAAITALIDGTADLGPMSRAPKDTEIEEAQGQGMELHIAVVGLDALIIIVNDNNPLDGLTVAQITDIYEGTVTSWADIGWTDGPTIQVKERDENSGTHDYFNEFFLEGEEVVPENVNGHEQFSSTSQLFETVASEDGAIGYGGLAYLDDTVKAVTVDGVEATKVNAKDGSYPVVRPLFVVFDIFTVSEIALELVRFVLSPEGQAIVDSTGYVAIGSTSGTYTPKEFDASSEDSPIDFGFFFLGLSVITYAVYKKRKAESV